MSSWSKSALSGHAPVVSAKSFPTLSTKPTTVPDGPPSKKPIAVFTMAQKLKQSLEAEEAAAAAAASVAAAAAAAALAARIAETADKRQSTVIQSLYKPNKNGHYDDEYYIEDSNSDEVDYEMSVEFAEHLRYARKQRVPDYSKDLSDEDVNDGYEELAI